MVTKRLKFVRWWRRTGVAPRLLLFLLGAALLTFLVYSQLPQEEASSRPNNVLFFILVNLNIVILVVLAFLIGRNLVKLLFDRKRKILGSKLRLKLVTAFVGLSLVPTVILFVLASGFLTSAMEGWFSKQIETSVRGAVEVSKDHYRWIKGNVRRNSTDLLSELSGKSVIVNGKLDDKLLVQTIDRFREHNNLFSIRVVDSDGTVVAESSNAASAVEDFREPALRLDSLKKVGHGKEFVLLEEKAQSQYVRSYSPFTLGDRHLVLVVSYRIDPNLSTALNSVVDSFEEYQQLKFFKQPLRTGYILTLSMITGLILFAAIWLGFYLARELTVPILRLAEGTKEIARGNYDVQIRTSGDDEISTLVEAFNTMTGDIKKSRRELESRRSYLETILSNLAVGVVSVNRKMELTLVNEAASRLFSQEKFDNTGRPLSQLLDKVLYDRVIELISRLDTPGQSESDSPTVVEQINLRSNERELKIVCTAGKILDAKQNWLGTVLLFDDVSEIARLEQLVAWREVAQRIAHEIKNPLTPIQLSAQRLEKLVLAKDYGPAVQECTQTIVEHVASIKRLANEFSKFARMPTVELKLCDLNALISECIAPYAESNSGVVFQAILDHRLPQIFVDPEQMRRIIINLVDNALSALNNSGDVRADHPKVIIRTKFDAGSGKTSMEVSDNGPGVIEADKQKIFEPYFTTKPHGTGLGLAIVASIVKDHRGTIRVTNNTPRGARFVIEFPPAAIKAQQASG